MRNLKRVLSLSLALVMILGLMIVGTGASAADFTDQDEIVNEDAVNILVALNIIAGKDDGSYFDPTGIVTRGEMAKMICIALNGGIEPVLGTGSSFTDTVNHWASSYIEYCVNLKIVAGRGNGTFDPNATVTATEAAKMLLVAMNYDPAVFGLTGDSWDINTNTEANKAGLYEDLSHISASAGLTRDNAAQMIYNAIQAQTMKMGWNQNMATGEITQSWSRTGDSILVDKYKVIEAKGQMVDFTYDSDKGEWTYDIGYFVEDGKDAQDNPKYVFEGRAFKTDSDFTNLFGMEVKALYKTVSGKTTVYGIMTNDSSVLAEGILGNIGSIKTDSVKFDGTVYKFDAGTWAGTNIIDFGTGNIRAKAADNKIAVTDKAYECKLIDNDNDGKVDVVVAFPFSVAKVTYVGAKSFTVEGKGSKTIEDVNVYKGLAKNDYVKMVAGVNAADEKDTFTKVDSVLEGKVTGIQDGGAKFQIDGTWYNFAVADKTVSVGSTVEKVPVVNGYAFAASEKTAVSATDYVVVAKSVKSANNGMNGDQAKLLFSDGTSKIVDTDKYYDNAGDLMTYEINSDDEYVLTPADTTNTESSTHGFDKAYASASYAYAKDGKSTIASNYIADDAVIFVQKGTEEDGYSYKVITGAELKKSATASVTAGSVTAYTEENSSTGYETVVMAYVASTSGIDSGETKYGYVTSDVSIVKNDDDKSVGQFTMWTEDGSKTVLTTNTAADNKITVSAVDLVKGAIIAYTEDGADVKIESITVLSGTTAAAITAYNGSDEISYKSGTSASENVDGKTGDETVIASSATTTSKKEIDKDTVILYINVEDKAGVEGAAIDLATKTAAGNYIANAYVAVSGDKVSVIVVDVANDILDIIK